MQADLKRPSELTEAERGAWAAFRAAGPLLDIPYFAPEFAQACEMARGDARVAVIRRGGAVKAFLPLHTGRVGYARPLGGPLGDYHGLIAEPGFDARATDILRAAGVPVFEFHSVLAAQGAFRPHHAWRDGSWVIDLSEGYDGFIEARSAAEAKAFRNIRSRRRKLEEAEDGFEFILDDPDPAVFETMVAWKRAQYRRTGVFDVFSVGWTNRLMRDIAGRRGDGFAGCVSSLRIGGRIAAVHVGMRSATAMHYWFPAYDPAFSNYGPGLALLLEIARGSAAQGVTAIHLGPGDYDFKQHLGGYQIGLAAGCVAAPSMVAALRGVTTRMAGALERAPLGPVSAWPGKALRKIDRLAAFYAA